MFHLKNDKKSPETMVVSGLFCVDLNIVLFVFKNKVFENII